MVQALQKVRERIAQVCEAAGRDAREVAILAVTKGFGSEAIEAALAAGLRDIGENYYQEAAAKFAPVRWPEGARRHFIGRVQRNKAAKIARLFDVAQSVDRPELADWLERASAGAGKKLDVLIELNVTGDDRAGVAPGAAPDLARRIRAHPNLRLRGVMAIGPLDRVRVPEAFARAADCYRALRAQSPQIDTLSLGMTADLEEAVAAGSTLVRLGTALFGERPSKGTTRKG